MSNVSEYLESWRAARLEQVAGPAGNIALVDYQPVGTAAQQIRGFDATVRRNPGEPGVWIVPGRDGLLRRTAEGDAPLAAGSETFLALRGGDGFPLLIDDRRTIDAFSLDGSDIELRIYDADAPGFARFAGIDVCAYDDAWVLSGIFRAHDEVQHVPWGFTRQTDTGHAKAVPGVIEVTVAGESHAFTVFADHGALVLVFADGTTGTDSYAPGRFLKMDAAETGAGVTLDFNFAIVPPCGFSDFYSCPLPPPENRVTAPIRAGEMRALWS